MKSCFLCQKHVGEVAQPPGGYIYEGAHWLVCHAPADKGPLGTLFIESRRHFLDYAEANEEELAEYGPLLKKVYAVLKSLTGAERIYQVVFLEGIPHFHAWLVPRRKEDEERGVPFISKDIVCRQGEAEELAEALQIMLSLEIRFHEYPRFLAVELLRDSDGNAFQMIADELSKKFKVKWKKKIEGFDQRYWDFRYKGVTLTLHLEHYLGIMVIVGKKDSKIKKATQLLHEFEDYFQTWKPPIKIGKQ